MEVPDWGAVYSSPQVINGVLYVGSDDHFVYALNASDGSFKWKYQTRDIVQSSPQVVNSVVYIGSWYFIYALNAIDGSLKWKFQTGYYVEYSPKVVNGIVYVGSDDGYVYALYA